MIPTYVLDSVNYGSLKLKSLTPDVLTRTSEFPIPILWQLPHKEMGTRIICASCVVPLIRMMELSLQSCNCVWKFIGALFPCKRFMTTGKCLAT